jgi:2-keto-4-pentenoate hydratase/2-oxohepta-3-ene-1,7-dioic acid hydratase in catechol pathway
MKLIRFGPAGRERPGAIDSAGVRRDLSGVIDDLKGDALSPASIARLKALDLSALPAVPDDVRLGSCVARPGNFIGIGLNYADHAAEAGMGTPDGVESLVFNKATNCVVGPNDDIMLPPGSVSTDWEAELAIVIGSPAWQISEAEAPAAIAGYCVCNDVSERDYQKNRGGQFTKGKGCPTFGPLGPWLVTPDEIADVQNLGVWLKLNGEAMQQGNTAQMMAGAYRLVSYLSGFMLLEPGDVITTGTPAGVGMARTPPVYLRPGDVVELGIDGLGVQRQRVVQG